MLKRTDEFGNVTRTSLQEEIGRTLREAAHPVVLKGAEDQGDRLAGLYLNLLQLLIDKGVVTWADVNERILGSVEVGEWVEPAAESELEPQDSEDVYLRLCRGEDVPGVQTFKVPED